VQRVVLAGEQEWEGERVQEQREPVLALGYLLEESGQELESMKGWVQEPH
jgi:hypothetical protein